MFLCKFQSFGSGTNAQFSKRFFFKFVCPLVHRLDLNTIGIESMYTINGYIKLNEYIAIPKIRKL